MLPGENQFVVLVLKVKFKGPVDAVKLFANAAVGKARAKSVNSTIRLMLTSSCRKVFGPSQ
jgi:hypothetical protein